MGVAALMGAGSGGHMLAHLVFRNVDGSFNAIGWFWLALSVVVVIGAAWNLVLPQRMIQKTEWLKTASHPLAKLRLLATVALVVGVLFIVVAVSSGPGQIV